MDTKKQTTTDLYGELIKEAKANLDSSETRQDSEGDRRQQYG